MRSRRRPAVVAGLAAASTVAGSLAWRDLNRRTDAQIRGSRRMWRVIIALNPGNSILYWLFGRR